MLWSKTVIPSLREDPQEAEITSHKLMLRAGLIRRLTGGLYTFLPLGLRALHKVERVIREEMDGAGALEVLMPALQPREIWDRSGRYELMGDVMYRLRDRQEREMVLGPTHEEVITQLASREITSYRQLPRIFYQIQSKFRDEIRPRFGLIRAKEFIMKDAYSFDSGWDEADVSYQTMYSAYTRIFERCSLTIRVVEADTGAIGGKWSHEFMVLASSGEDVLVECDTCSYGANLERAERGFAVLNTRKATDSQERNGEKIREVTTPDSRTIDQVSKFFNCAPDRLIKTLIYLIDGGTAAVLIPGDRELNENKLIRSADAGVVTLANDETIATVTGAPVGFAGPVGLDIPVYADLSLKGYTGAVAGANKADAHVANVNLDRDANVSGYYDLCYAKNGDSCPHCNGTLRKKRGIEVGHVFKLGTKYSESFDACYLDAEGRKKPTVMGCYGIGVTRMLQAIIEQSHDEHGIIWPMAVAPYRVLLLVPDVNHCQSMNVAETLMTNLEDRGVDVLLDDRDKRAGVKFNDADLLGFPVRVVVSKRSLAGGNVEIKLRADKKADLVPVAGMEDRIIALCEETRGARMNTDNERLSTISTRGHHDKERPGR